MLSGNRAHVAGDDALRPSESALQTCLRWQAAVAGCCHTLVHMAMHWCPATLQLPPRVGCQRRGGACTMHEPAMLCLLCLVQPIMPHSVRSAREACAFCSHVGTNLGWSARPGSVDSCSGALASMFDDQAGMVQPCVFEKDSCMLRWLVCSQHRINFATVKAHTTQAC